MDVYLMGPSASALINPNGWHNIYHIAGGGDDTTRLSFRILSPGHEMEASSPTETLLAHDPAACERGDHSLKLHGGEKGWQEPSPTFTSNHAIVSHDESERMSQSEQAELQQIGSQKSA